MPWKFIRRNHDKLGLAVLVGLVLLLAGYQVYAWQVQHRNARVAVVATSTAAKVQKLSQGQCNQTVLLYQLLNALMEDTSPAFGSPPDGPPVRGARQTLINRVHSAERTSIQALEKQGCHIKRSEIP